MQLWKTKGLVMKSRKSIKTEHLALMSGAVFDIPPKIRSILVIVGFIGVVLIFIESLVGRQEQTIQIDKILHFSGYGFLAAVFVLVLQPKQYIAGLIGLVGMGIGIEILQAATVRTPDMADVYANTLGVIFGGGLGLAIRHGYAYLNKDLALQTAKKNLRRFGPGQVIMHEGRMLKDLFIIKTGKVKVERRVGDKQVRIADLSVGDVIGYSGAILGEKQFTTVTTLEKTTIYKLSFEELKASAGGQEMPVSMVLMSLTRKLKEAGEKLAAANISLN